MKIKKCKICKDQTEDYKKINNIKITLCCEKCEIEYVLKRFLKRSYSYCNHSGTLSTYTY